MAEFHIYLYVKLTGGNLSFFVGRVGVVYGSCRSWGLEVILKGW